MNSAVRGALTRASNPGAAAALPFVDLTTLVLLLWPFTLGTPAYWDELGWLGQAHWLSEQSLLAATPSLRP